MSGTALIFPLMYNKATINKNTKIAPMFNVRIENRGVLLTYFFILSDLSYFSESK